MPHPLRADETRSRASSRRQRCDRTASSRAQVTTVPAAPKAPRRPGRRTERGRERSNDASECRRSTGSIEAFERTASMLWQVCANNERSRAWRASAARGRAGPELVVQGPSRPAAPGVSEAAGGASRPVREGTVLDVPYPFRNKTGENLQNTRETRGIPRDISKVSRDTNRGS